MALMNTLRDPVCIAIPRNCHRCGEEFQAYGAERVCRKCRKPKVRECRPVSRELSLREKQIVERILQAKSNKEIAWELHVVEGTIKEYLNRIYCKLEVRNRTGLAVWALRKQGEKEP
jgi:DNA-binding NarL/FixJ family response regulator